MLVFGGQCAPRRVADDIKRLSTCFSESPELVCCGGSRADGDQMWQGKVWTSATLLCCSDAFWLDSMYFPADVFHPYPCVAWCSRVRGFGDASPDLLKDVPHPLTCEWQGPAS